MVYFKRMICCRNYHCLKLQQYKTVFVKTHLGDSEHATMFALRLSDIKLQVITFVCINRRKYWFDENFQLLFSLDLRVVECPEYDLQFLKNVCLSVCVTKIFGASIVRELIHKIS